MWPNDVFLVRAAPMLPQPLGEGTVTGSQQDARIVQWHCG